MAQVGAAFLVCACARQPFSKLVVSAPEDVACRAAFRFGWPFGLGLSC